MRQFVYIKLVAICLALSVLAYSVTLMDIGGADTFRNGATYSDVIYFTACYFSQLFASLAFSFVMLFVAENFNHMLIISLKYASFAISVVLMWRTLFNILNYEKIYRPEIIIDTVCVSMVAFRLCLSVMYKLKGNE